MVLELDSWAVNGAESSPRIARLQLQSATRSGRGIVESRDLQIVDLDVPGAAVKALSGAGVMLGREAVFQGSYYAFNVGDETIPINPTGSGAGRSDMVILRVEDPNIDGTPWLHDVTTDPVYYFRVLQGVAANAVDVPAGVTGIPLARIDIPPSTGTITQSMIKDLRQMLNPRTQRVLRVQQGGTQTGGTWDEAGDYTADFERWPQHEWTVEIPSWATQAQILSNWDMAFYKAPTGMTGAHDARGQVRTGLVNMPGGPLYTRANTYNFNPTSVGNGYSVNLANRDQIAIPSAARGSTATLRMYAKGDSGQLGRIVASASAHFSVDIEFLEVPTGRATL